jgi:hypothetical protein
MLAKLQPVMVMAAGVPPAIIDTLTVTRTPAVTELPVHTVELDMMVLALTTVCAYATRNVETVTSTRNS